jgi:hypothetical protein
MFLIQPPMEGTMVNEAKQAQFTETVAAGSRTYLFDVKTSKTGTKYLTIHESRKNAQGKEPGRIMVFAENIESFARAFEKAVTFLSSESGAKR